MFILILIILTAIGVWCFVNGFGSAGMLFILPALITVVIKIMRALIENEKYEDSRRAWEEARQKELDEEKRKDDAVKQQKELTEQYRNGPLIGDVLKVICGGNSRKNTPERIIIENSRIQGILNGQTLTYDFPINRVSALPLVIRTVDSREELEYVVRPQIAMANAINSLLGSKYEIYDNAEEKDNFQTDIDGDFYRTITYVSDHVVMVLKSTLPNKSF